MQKSLGRLGPSFPANWTFSQTPSVGSGGGDCLDYFGAVVAVVFPTCKLHNLQHTLKLECCMDCPAMLPHGHIALGFEVMCSEFQTPDLPQN